MSHCRGMNKNRRESREESAEGEQQPPPSAKHNHGLVVLPSPAFSIAAKRKVSWTCHGIEGESVERGVRRSLGNFLFGTS